MPEYKSLMQLEDAVALARAALGGVADRRRERGAEDDDDPNVSVDAFALERILETVESRLESQRA